MWLLGKSIVPLYYPEKPSFQADLRDFFPFLNIQQTEGTYFRQVFWHKREILGQFESKYGNKRREIAGKGPFSWKIMRNL